MKIPERRSMIQAWMACAVVGMVLLAIPATQGHEVYFTIGFTALGLALLFAMIFALLLEIWKK